MAVMTSPKPRGTQKEGSCIFVVAADVPKRQAQRVGVHAAGNFAPTSRP